ncbi:hypothetical protein [Haloterrigena alkaliphila]|uniref:Uncharacterized protein n=1 Tax=Haloterrigena alkaliphila TaxID=2816475 RepID=A0A8A2V9A1_9EURY|nr:hypothetical protein [Haloterrigena alkaliphila]QSW98513.1 hypothetical protein J0X25_14065 [Haloterrigena alkaliphila]
MNRRSLLAGAAASSAALAGCFSAAESAPAENGPDETPPEPPEDPDDPIARSAIGTRSDDPASRVRLWNLADQRHRVDLEIESASETLSFDGSYDLDPDAHVVVLLRGRDEYEATVTVDDDEARSVELEASSFDDPCPATELFVLEDGAFDATTKSNADHCTD